VVNSALRLKASRENLVVLSELVFRAYLSINQLMHSSENNQASLLQEKTNLDRYLEQISQLTNQALIS
jgi:hypothetical protein